MKERISYLVYIPSALRDMPEADVQSDLTATLVSYVKTRAERYRNTTPSERESLDVSFGRWSHNVVFSSDDPKEFMEKIVVYRDRRAKLIEGLAKHLRRACGELYRTRGTLDIGEIVTQNALMGGGPNVASFLFGMIADQLDACFTTTSKFFNCWSHNTAITPDTMEAFSKDPSAWALVVFGDNSHQNR